MGIHSQNRNWKELNLYTRLASSFSKTQGCCQKVSKTKDIAD